MTCVLQLTHHTQLAFVLQVTILCYTWLMDETNNKPPVQYRSQCPLCQSLDLFGDKWSLIIIRDMLLFKKQLFNDFLESSEKISTNILTNRLKRLEETGLITKQAYQDHPPRYAYQLTERGLMLKPVILEMMKWGMVNLKDMPETTTASVADMFGL